MTRSHSTGRWMSRCALILLTAIAISGIVFGGFRAAGTRLEGEAMLSGLADRPLQFEISEPAQFQALLLGLRSYHYRARRKGITAIREFYYDTHDWKLARLGYSYRIVEHLAEDGTATYSISMTGYDAQKEIFEIDDQLDESLGESITSGSWKRALTAQRDLPSLERLQEALRAHEINEKELTVRGVGDATISHFDVTDKGSNWFRMVYEEWTISSLEVENPVSFHWYGVTLSVSRTPRSKEFTSRVEQLEQVLPTFYQFQSEATPRLVRALDALSRG